MIENGVETHQPFNSQKIQRSTRILELKRFSTLLLKFYLETFCLYYIFIFFKICVCSLAAIQRTSSLVSESCITELLYFTLCQINVCTIIITIIIVLVYVVAETI